MNRNPVPPSQATPPGPGWRANDLAAASSGTTAALPGEVAKLRITRQVAEDPRTLLYLAERGDERAYLRVLRKPLSDDPATAARFIESAKLLRRMRFPGLAKIVEAGTRPDGCAYVLVQPALGELLSERIGRGESLAPLAPALGPLAKGLSMLHAQGLCHLGIEPAHIQVPAGAEPALQLLDSEYARSQAMALPPPTIVDAQVREGIDPALFMAPEILREGAMLGPPADVYALGVLAYYVLCGRPPLRVGSTGEIKAAHRDLAPTPIRDVAPSVPEELARLIGAMLDGDPDRRPAMALVAKQWAPLISALPPPTPQPQPLPPPQPPPQPPPRLEPPRPVPPEPPRPIPPEPSQPLQAPPQPVVTPPDHTSFLRRRSPWIIAGIALIAVAIPAAIIKVKQWLDPPPPASPALLQLTVRIAGTGEGSVTGPGINCRTECKQIRISADTVELTATPAAGSSFAGWSGCTYSRGAICMVDVNQDTIITAQFSTSAGGNGDVPILPPTGTLEIINRPSPVIPDDVAKPPANAETLPSGTKFVVVKPGTGKDKARQFDTVTYNYTAWDGTGRMIDTTEVRKNSVTAPPYKQSVGMGEMLTALTAGERARFWVDAKKMTSDDKTLPGGQQGLLCYEVEALQIVKAKHEVPPTPPDVAKPPDGANKTAKGVFYRVLKAGPGKDPRHPAPNDTVKVHYTGWTTDGWMFDSSDLRDEPATFNLQGVVAGWTDGIPVMTIGDRVRFWIPEELAFTGAAAKPKGMLVFDVELLEIVAPTNH